MGEASWSSLFLKDCIQWKRTHCGVLEELQPTGRTHIGYVCHGLHLITEHGSSMRRKEWQRQNVMYCPQRPLPIPSVLLTGEKTEDSGAKMNPGRGGEVEDRGFFSSH